MTVTLGSLFDGSGGFPLAGIMCGIVPVWASEIDPYPIAVTTSRFPDMKHLGDISKINGASIEPVDIITFGSPCQDLSVAGKRAGLKHSINGDEETTRSGLFMEAVRIIKEMRCATNGKYPRFALWENVPGAFSSNKGEDFRIVLEELIKITEEKATVPPAPKGGWPYADAYVGDGWSLAYRTFDAQYWGVPQRRRRIYLVADFAGGCASRILFEREGVRGYFAKGESPWQRVASNVERSVRTDDSKRNAIINAQSASESDISACLCATYETKWNGNAGAYNGEDFVLETRTNVEGLDGYNNSLTGDKAATLGVNCGMSTGRNGVLVTAGFKAGQGAKAGGLGWQEEIVPTLTGVPSGTNQIPTVCTAFAQNQRNEVRDLKGVAGALAAHHGMKQQTYIVEKLVLDDQGGSQIGVRTDGKSPTLRAEMHGNIPCVMDIADFGAQQDIVAFSFDSLGSNSMKSKNPHSGCRQVNVAKTLDTTDPNPCKNQGGIAILHPFVLFEPRSQDGVPRIHGNIVPTLNTAQGGQRQPCVAGSVYCVQGNCIDRADTAGCNGKGWREGASFTLNTIDRPAVAYLASGKDKFGTLMANCGTKQWLGNQEVFSGNYHVIEEHKVSYIVRRLTPTECARLQGFADAWGYP